MISQSDAARLRGVSRQAIGRLIKRGKLQVISIGGRRFLSRQDVVHFEPARPGRPTTTEPNESP
ncbi:MAG: helix-turn-helix domain-containing protein [Gemmatimonadales bacterium]